MQKIGLIKLIQNEIYQLKYKPIFMKLGNHSVVALIILIVIGGATRVMEAGLACPDWPLCYGTFIPFQHFNLKVFLEWFHRLDAFFVGILILFKFILSLLWKKNLPNWLPKIYSVLLFLIILQGSLGALTVIKLLDSFTVIGHLLIAFTLLITNISINQNLEINNMKTPIIWWKLLVSIPLLLTLIQSTIGVRLSSTWSAQLCISLKQQCLILNSHKLFAIPVSVSILCIFFTSIFKENLFIKNWRYISSILFLLISQIFLGVLSLKTNLNEPIFIIGHQLIAALIIAILTTLIFRNPYLSKDIKPSLNPSIVGF